MPTGLITSGMKFVTGLAGTGPWGVAAIVVGLLSMVGAAAFAIARSNRQTDEADQDQGGADAGVTAQTLKNQADINREWWKQAREDFDNSQKPST